MLSEYSRRRFNCGISLNMAMAQAHSLGLQVKSSGYEGINFVIQSFRMGFLSGWKGVVPCFTSFSSFPNFLCWFNLEIQVQVIASDEGTSRFFFIAFLFLLQRDRAAKSQGLHGPASPWCCFGRGKRDGTTNSDSMIKIFHDSPRFSTSRSCQKHRLRQ